MYCKSRNSCILNSQDSGFFLPNLGPNFCPSPKVLKKNTARIESSYVERQKLYKISPMCHFSPIPMWSSFEINLAIMYFTPVHKILLIQTLTKSWTVYCIQNTDQVRTYQLICPNSSCSCRRSSARSVSMLEELEEPEEEGEEEREWRWSWPLHRAMLWDFIRDSTRCTFAPTEWLAVSDWGREITVSEMGNI